MRRSMLFLPFLLVCSVRFVSYAQNPAPALPNIGDPAPPLTVREWLKGSPVQRFEKGKAYVIEFWATWCKPCIAAMPHLSTLARHYGDSITIVGVSVKERKATTRQRLKAFVDSMGTRMDYHVATDDSNQMEGGWLQAFGELEQGIPRTFVVDGEGKVAWIGHPLDVDDVLSKVVKNTWDIKEALARRNENKQLFDLDTAADYMVYPYMADPKKRRDSALFVIDELIRKEPKLKYTPRIASYTFRLLLETNPQKAYEYGKAVLVTPTYVDPDPGMITGAIRSYSDKSNLPTEIYQLGAEAYQVQIKQIAFPELVNMAKLYTNMAEMCWRAKDKAGAIDAQQKAIDWLKSRNDFSKTEVAVFETRLRQYKERQTQERR